MNYCTCGKRIVSAVTLRNMVIHWKHLDDGIICIEEQ